MFRSVLREARAGGSVRGTTSLFGTLRRPNLRYKESMFRLLDMSGVSMICFRLRSAFGTGMALMLCLQ